MMAFLWDYLLAIRLRLDKASRKTIENREHSQDFLNFLNHAHDDLSNALVIIHELREQRNSAYKDNPHFSEAGANLAIEASDKRIEDLLSFDNEVVSPKG